MTTPVDDLTREFLFEYRFGDATWSTTVFANDANEAKEKIKAQGMASYKGEIGERIPVSLSGFGLLPRLLIWWRNRKATP